MNESLPGWKFIKIPQRFKVAPTFPCGKDNCKDKFFPFEGYAHFEFLSQWKWKKFSPQKAVPVTPLTLTITQAVRVSSSLLQDLLRAKQGKGYSEGAIVFWLIGEEYSLLGKKKRRHTMSNSDTSNGLTDSLQDKKKLPEIQVIIPPGTNFSEVEQLENQPLRDVLDVEVSWFQSYSAKIPTTIKLLWWLELLETNVFKQEIDKIRSPSFEAVREELKGQLPCITPSGVFTGRTADKLIEHSCLLQLDIDAKPNSHITNLSQLKEQIQNIVNVAYCGQSASGKGYWVLVPIKEPERQKDHFDSLSKAFKQFGVVLDSKPKNVNSLRGYSHDDDPYLNHYAIPLRLAPKSPEKRKEIKPIAAGKPIVTGTGNNDYKRVESCVVQIEARGIDITSGYKRWFNIGCGLANTFGDDGRDLFHRVSQFNHEYSVKKTDDEYRKYLKYEYTGITLGSFFRFCEWEGIFPSLISASKGGMNNGDPHPDLSGKRNIQAGKEPGSTDHSARLNNDDLQQSAVAANAEKNTAPDPLVQENQTPFDRLKEKYPAIAVLAEKLELEVVKPVQEKC